MQIPKKLPCELTLVSECVPVCVCVCVCVCAARLGHDGVGEERVDAERVVKDHAGDAPIMGHGGAAVVALRVELEGPFFGVRVALPSGAADVTRGLSSARSRLSLRR